MLYDDVFVRAVYADPAAATADCDLLPAEQGWLVSPDPRAYQVDPLRRTRALTGLIEEYAVACAVLVRAHGREATLDALDAFFSCEAFHAGVQSGASLAGCFGAWLTSGGVGISHHELQRVAALELALARARRARDFAPHFSPSSEPDLRRTTLVLAPGVLVHEAPRGLVSRYGASIVDLRGRGLSLVDAVLDPRHALPGLVCGDEREGVIVDARTAEARLETASLELVRILALCAAPIAFADLLVGAAAHGADADDCLGIATSFTADGLLQSVVRA